MCLCQISYLATEEYAPTSLVLILVARPVIVLATGDQQALLGGQLELAEETGLDLTVGLLDEETAHVDRPVFHH